MPIIVGTYIKAFITFSDVDQDEALPGLEQVIASCSPLAPNSKNKTPNKKKPVGIPNDFTCLFAKIHPFLLQNHCIRSGVEVPLKKHPH